MHTPTFVYDDDCGFCTWWADLIERNSDLAVVGYSRLSDKLRDRLPGDYEDCSHLVTDDEVFSCGASVEEAVDRSDLEVPFDSVLDFVRNFEDYDALREGGYQLVANNRDVMGKVVSKRPPARRGTED